MRLVAALVLLAAAGCAEPPIDGALKCGAAAHACPASFSCVDGRCWASGHVFDLAVELPPDDLASTDLAMLPDAAIPEDMTPIYDFAGCIPLGDPCSTAAPMCCPGQVCNMQGFCKAKP